MPDLNPIFNYIFSIYPLQIIISLYVFWLLYLAVMNLYKAHLTKTITKPALILGYPILAIGAVVDATLNITLFTIVFLEIPKELLLTKRMQRHIKSGSGFRYNISSFICTKFLNAFDPSGNHCD